MEARRLSPQPRAGAFAIMLRIRHPDLDPEDISRELRLSADHFFKAGEARESSAGLEHRSVHTESCWLGTLHPAEWTAATPASTGTVDPHLSAERVHDVLASDPGSALAMCVTHLRRHAAFLHRVTAGGGQIDLRIALDPAVIGGFALAPQYIRVLSELGVAVELEFGDR